MDTISAWKISSDERSGFHCIAGPEKGNTKSLWIYRLNLEKDQEFTFTDPDREFSFATIRGIATLEHKKDKFTLHKLDSFYLPSDDTVTIQAHTNCVFYIGAAVDEGYGQFFFHPFNPELKIGEIRQVHGQPPYRRDVYMTLGPEKEASRLICGFTWSDQGGWSSWPPHQHEKDLEEAYCYFDMDPPGFGIHLSYMETGKPTHCHIVQTGDFILAPLGYHPTVASPAVKNCYFWILGAHSHASRRYDLAVNDPAYVN